MTGTVTAVPSALMGVLASSSGHVTRAARQVPTQLSQSQRYCKRQARGMKTGSSRQRLATVVGFASGRWQSVISQRRLLGQVLEEMINNRSCS
jgi:hypothetical protein